MSSSLSPNPSGPSAEAQLNFGRILKKVNRKLTKGFDSEKILEFLFESLEILIPYDRIGIALVEGEGNARRIYSKWVRSKIPIDHLKIGYSARLHESSLEKILESGHPRIINDLREYAHDHPDSKFTQLILKDGILSSLTCPMYLEGEPVGIVFFSSAQAQTYKNEHVQTYSEIADEFSVLIERGRLRQKFESDLSKAQNLRMVLHDLKNPLGVIQGFLDLAQDMDWYQGLDSEAKNIFSVLQRNSNRMVELLNELSEITTIDAQVGQIEEAEVVLQDFIAELALMGRESAERKEIRVSMTVDKDLPEKGVFDAARVRRVMDNLISNAIKYSERKTQIHISIKLDERRLIFEVKDQGQGIPEREIEKLFREFGRTSVKPTEGETSTGLGLAIAKRIVQQHGGQIYVQSQVGIGSTFSFWLPLRNYQ